MTDACFDALCCHDECRRAAERRSWPCDHSDSGTICAAGFCIRCGERFWAVRCFMRFRARRGGRIRERLRSRDGELCVYCRQEFSERREATIDHILPRALGGSNEFSNLCLACYDCNSRKGAHYPVPFGAYA